jgi:hypothetical protein
VRGWLCECEVLGQLRQIECLVDRSLGVLCADNALDALTLEGYDLEVGLAEADSLLKEPKP